MFFGIRRALIGTPLSCTPYSQIAGTVTVNATFLHPADGVVAWTQPIPASKHTVKFRILDASNYWKIDTYSNNQQYLIETIATVDNIRATANVVLAGGERYAVVLDGTAIYLFIAGVLRGTRTGATNFATQASGLFTRSGAGNIGDLKTWSLACRSMEGV